MCPRSGKKRATRFWGRVAVYSVVTTAFVIASVTAATAQQSEQPPPPEENPEAEIEPTPIPGTEILLTPQPPSPEAPLPGQTLKLGPPAVVEPLLPPVNFEALGRMGRLWSFHGIVKEFRFVGNHRFSNG